MKKLLFLLLLISFCSCEKAEIKQTKLETFINNYIAENPTWADNEITIESNTKIFKKDLEDQLKSGLLDDTVLEVADINKYGKQYSVHFIHWGDKTVDINSVLNGVNFDVIALMPEEEAIKLKIGSGYYVKGSFEGFANNNYSDYTQGNIYLDRVMMSKELTLQTPELGLGVIKLKPVTVIPFQEI